MYRWLTIAIAVLAVGILGVSVWGFSGLNKHAIIAIDEFGDSAKAATLNVSVIGSVALKLSDSIAAVKNDLVRPCKGPAGPDACGTFAEINKVAIASGDAVITTQMQVRSVTPLMTAAADAVSGAATHINGTADAATGFLKTSRDAVDQLNDDKTGLSPLMSAYLDDGRTLNDLLKRKAVADLLDNLAGITGKANHMVDVGDQVETKFTYSYLHPSKNPWVRTGNAIKPYAPLAVKSLSCWAVPGSCF